MKHAISLELKNHGKGDAFDEANSGYLKVKDEPMDYNNDDFFKEKSSDTSYWDNWTSSNFGMPTSSSQSKFPENSMLNSATTSLYSNTTNTKLTVPETISPSGSEIQSPLSGQQSPVTPTNPTSWGVPGRVAHAPQQQNDRQGMLSPHDQMMTNDRQIPSWSTDRPGHVLHPDNQVHVNDHHSGQLQSHGPVIGDKHRHNSQNQAQRLSLPERNSVPETGWQSGLAHKPRTLSPSNMPDPRSPVVPNTNTFETSQLTKIPIIEPNINKTSGCMDEKLKAVNELLGKNKNMDEFIGKIVEAGKCLQLLNYRVSIESSVVSVVRPLHVVSMMSWFEF